MKKRMLILLALLLVLGTFSAALAEKEPVTFTHPELGEIIEVSFHHHMPRITLYGYKYYEVMDTVNEPCRGMKTSGIYTVNSKSLTPQEAMTAFFASVEGRGSEPKALYNYTGLAAAYAEQLAALPEEQRISALLLLSGFGGAEGYPELQAFPGFENADTKALAAGYLNYTADIKGARADYRVAMFHITEQDGTFYLERYCFLRLHNSWRLHKITREYIDEYDARTHYIHGIAGSEPSELKDVNAQIMSGLAWGMIPEAVANMEKTAVTDGAVHITDALLFRLPARLDCLFTDEKLIGLTYTFTGSVTYYAAFVSLYMRYADPVTIDKDDTITWFLDDFTIMLRYDADHPVLTVSPRVPIQ